MTGKSAWRRFARRVFAPEVKPAETASLQKADHPHQREGIVLRLVGGCYRASVLSQIRPIRFSRHFLRNRNQNPARKTLYF